MWWPTMPVLAENDGGDTRLYWIIAVVIMWVVSGVFEKIKKLKTDAERRQAAPPSKKVVIQQGRSVQPRAERAAPRPARRRVPPSPPRARPAGREVAPHPAARPGQPTPRRSLPAVAQELRRRLIAAVAEGKPAVVPVGVETALQKELKQPKRDVPTPSQPQAAAKLRTERHPMTQPPRPRSARGLGSFRHLARDEIRRAIVLSEILGPPLALRDQPSLRGY